MSIQVHRRSSVGLQPPQRLAEVQETRLRELRRKVANYACRWHFKKPVFVRISQDASLVRNKDIFYAYTPDSTSIHLQNHWLLRPTDIPNTNDRGQLKQWFARFMDIPLQRIDDSFYEEVISPVIERVRLGDFEQIREFVLLHELGHIYEDLRAPQLIIRRKARQIAIALLACIALGMAAIAIVYTNFVALAIFLIAFIGCLPSYKRMILPPAKDNLKDHEKKADLFSARTNPQNVAAFIHYMQWLKRVYRSIRNNPALPTSARKCFTREGEFAHNTTYPSYSERIAYLQQFLLNRSSENRRKIV